MENYASSSVENFVKTIYVFGMSKGKDTRPGSVARKLGITSAAATDMARKLSAKKLVEYQKYKKLKLTSSGEKMAKRIIRRHRLWETFLHQILGLSMYEIHQEAELLEHATSDFLAEKISDYLGNPTTDPHGDPIPNKNGIYENNSDTIMLSEAEAGTSYEICRLSGSEKEFYDFCHSNYLNLGSQLKVNKQYIKNNMTEIEIGKVKLLLNKDFAHAVYVKPVNRNS